MTPEQTKALLWQLPWAVLGAAVVFGLTFLGTVTLVTSAGDAMIPAGISGLTTLAVALGLPLPGINANKPTTVLTDTTTLKREVVRAPDPDAHDDAPGGNV